MMNIFNTLMSRCSARLAVLVSLLCYVGSAAADNKIYIDDFSIQAGETKEIAINLETENTDIKSIRGTINLPEGLTVVANAYDNGVSLNLADRTNGFLGNINPMTGLFSMSGVGVTVQGTTGPIAYFKVTASESLAATSTISITDYTVKKTDNQPLEVGTEDATVTLHIVEELYCSFSENPVTLTTGETADIDVLLTNDISLNGLQATLAVTEGLTITAVTKSDRLTGWNYNPTSGKIISLGAVSGNEGAVFTVTLQATESFIGEATLTVSNIKGTTASAQSKPMETITLTVNVEAPQEPFVEFSFSETEVNLPQGEPVDVDVMLNTNLELTMFMATLTLPEGVNATVAKGDVLTADPNYANGKIIGQGINGTEGKLFTITLTAGENFNANSLVKLEKISATTRQAKSYKPADITMNVNAVATVTAAPVAKELTYTGEAQELVEAGTANGGEMQYSLDGQTFDPAIPKGTAVGSYTVYYKVVADDNHVVVEGDIPSVEAVIGKAALTEVTLESTELVYNAQEQTVNVAIVKAGELEVAEDFYTVSGNTGKDEGSYTVTVTAKENSNFEGTATAQFTIVPNEVNNNKYAELTAELDALQQALDDAEAGIAEEVAELFTEDIAAIQQMINNAREALEAANEAAALTNESTIENKETIETAIQQLIEEAAAAKEDYDNHAAFEEYKAEQEGVAATMAEDGDSEACAQLIADAQAAIEALQYDETKTLEENKARVDAIIEHLEADLAEQRAADQLTADKAAFEEYKDDQQEAAGNMAEDGDSEACAQLIADAQVAIEALQYDETKTLDENKALVDDIINQLEADLAAQRAKDVNDAKYEELKAELDVLQQELDEAEAGIAEEVADLFTEDVAAIQQMINDAREALEAANEAAALTDESTIEDKEAIETAIQQLMEEAAAAKEDYDNHVAFEEYKAEQEGVAANMAEDGDSEACAQLIADAQAAIEALQYDEEKTLDENKAEVDAIIEQLEADLADQRAKDVNDAKYEELKAELDALDEAIAAARETIEEEAPSFAEEYLAQLDALQDQVDAAREALEAANANVELTEESTNGDLPTQEDIDAIVDAALEAQSSILLPGDVTHSGVVDEDDVDEFINQLLEGTLPQPGDPDFDTYDVNGDGVLTIADAQAILNIANGLNWDGSVPDAARAEESTSTNVAINAQTNQLAGGITRYVITLTGETAITGFQMDVKGTKVISKQADNRRLLSNDHADGTCRIVYLATTGETIASGQLLTIDVMGSAEFDNICVTTAAARSIELTMGNATGINAIDAELQNATIYDMSGKMLKGMKKGMNIVRDADGNIKKKMVR